jgi:hypothetical protein
VLYVLLFVGLNNYTLKNILLAFGICLLQGLLIECLQGSDLIRERSFDAWDIAANAFGAFMAIFAVRYRYQRSAF